MKRLFFIIFTCCGNLAVYAGDTFSQIQRQANASPFVSIHALPGYSMPRLPAPGQIITEIGLDTSNEFHQRSTADESIQLDYERTQLNLGFVYGLKAGLSIGVAVPYVINSGGFLDSLIIDWHDAFRLPQGGRDQVPDDQFQIRYQNSASEIRVEQTGEGIGDIWVFVDKSILDADQHRLKLRMQLKGPTGDESQLFGSGGFGFALSAHGARQLSDNWQAYGMLGLNLLERGDILASQQNSFVANAVMGLAWSITPRFNLSAQLDLNSKVYRDTDLEALSGDAGVLSVSAGYTLTENTHLVIGFNEDLINRDAAPDFGITAAFNYRFD